MQNFDSQNQEAESSLVIDIISFTFQIVLEVLSFMMSLVLSVISSC